VRTELVIFDCDGVLVDSEVISNEVLGHVVTELGWPMTREQAIRRFRGRVMPEIWREVEAELGIAIGPAIDAEFRARQLAALARDVRPVEFVHELLAALTVPFCVASNGPHEKMRTTLGATGLLSSFEGRIFSRVDVPQGKPAPDLFLHAARSLGAEPARCLVLDDSDLGIEAALRAGMRPIGFAGTVTADARSLADAGAEAVVSDLRDLLALL
jgi:HAD superfamily hydrolase (TIGR01509 family)